MSPSCLQASGTIEYEIRIESILPPTLVFGDAVLSSLRCLQASWMPVGTMDACRHSRVQKCLESTLPPTPGKINVFNADKFHIKNCTIYQLRRYLNLYKKLSNYVTNMHIKWKIRVLCIYGVKQKLSFVNTKNTSVLFHGTPKENLCNILINDLKVQPNDVRRTGAMFGRGLYFADRSSKSALYSAWFSVPYRLQKRAISLNEEAGLLLSQRTFPTVFSRQLHK